MRTKTIYTDEELATVEAVENGEYVSLPKDEFELLIVLHYTTMKSSRKLPFFNLFD